MTHIQMKPKTIARRQAEQNAKDAESRKVFLATYQSVRSQFPEIPAEPPASGARYETELADGRYLNISVDRWQAF